MSPRREALHIAAVQCVEHPGDLAGTAAEHGRQIAEAADAGADVVLFPELSLTGYEPELIDLHRISIPVNSPLLDPISTSCRQRRVHALVGAPTGTGPLPQIGVLHVDPRGTVRFAYAKQHLQVGEVGIFSGGSSGAMIDVNGWKLGPVGRRRRRSGGTHSSSPSSCSRRLPGRCPVRDRLRESAPGADASRCPGHVGCAGAILRWYRRWTCLRRQRGMATRRQRGGPARYRPWDRRGGRRRSRSRALRRWP